MDDSRLFVVFTSHIFLPSLKLNKKKELSLPQSGERSEEGGGNGQSEWEEGRRWGRTVCKKREKNREERGRILPKSTGLRGNLPLLLDPRLFFVPTLWLLLHFSVFTAASVGPAQGHPPPSLRAELAKTKTTHNTKLYTQDAIFSNVLHSVFTCCGK